MIADASNSSAVAELINDYYRGVPLHTARRKLHAALHIARLHTARMLHSTLHSMLILHSMLTRRASPAGGCLCCLRLGALANEAAFLSCAHLKALWR